MNDNSLEKNSQTKRKISILDHIEDIITLVIVIGTVIATSIYRHHFNSALPILIPASIAIILQVVNILKYGNKYVWSCVTYLVLIFSILFIPLINTLFSDGPVSASMYFYYNYLYFTIPIIAISILLIVRQIRVYKTSILNQKEETKKFLFSDYIEDIVLFIIIIVTFLLVPLEVMSYIDDYELNILFLFPIVLEIINIFSKNKNNRGISNIIYGIVIFRFALMPFMLFVSGRVLNVFALDYFESSYIMLPIVVVLIIIKNLRVYKKSTIKVIKEEAN